MDIGLSLNVSPSGLIYYSQTFNHNELLSLAPTTFARGERVSRRGQRAGCPLFNLHNGFEPDGQRPSEHFRLSSRRVYP